PDGKAFGLYDAPLREIHALAPAADGSIYALALSDAASTTRAAGQSATTEAATTAAAALTGVTEEASATQPAQPSVPARSRNDLANVRSAVFHIQPDGVTDIVWSSTSVTGFAVTSARGGVLIGTSEKGRS